MYMLLGNMPMIALNSFLAIIPLVCGWFMVKTRHKWLLLTSTLFWFFFLPNTLYILADLRHLPQQWQQVQTAGKIAVALQYFFYELFGVGCFLLALYPLEKLLLRSRWRNNYIVQAICLIVVNFCVGFGIVLGGVHRLNSWDIITNVPGVIAASLQILFSFKLLLLAVFFGVVANVTYFVFREYREATIAIISKWRRRIISLVNSSMQSLVSIS